MMKKNNPHEKKQPLKLLFEHLVEYQHYYLPLLALIVLGIPLIINLAQSDPLIIGSESYHNLYVAEKFSGENPTFNIIHALIKLIPTDVLFLLPSLLGIVSIFLFTQIRLPFPKEAVFFFLLLTVLSPFFLAAFSTISAYSVVIFLFLAGSFLLQRNWNFLGTAFFVLATSVDVYSGLLALIFLILYAYARKEKTYYIGASLIFISIIMQIFLRHTTVFIGPFSSMGSFNIVSDLGAMSGVSAFIILLAVIGIISTRIPALYILVVPLTLGFIYSNETQIFMSFLLAFLAGQGLYMLYTRNWVLEDIKKVTFFILILGILFSYVTYVDRFSDTGPTAGDVDALRWIEETTYKNTIIFSSPENSYYIRYFAERTPYLEPHKTDRYKSNQTTTVFKALYISKLFPLLEQNNIDTLFITDAMRKQYPDEQGLFYLLKNERFKLVYSNKEAEVWMFERER